MSPFALIGALFTANVPALITSALILIPEFPDCNEPIWLYSLSRYIVEVTVIPDITTSLGAYPVDVKNLSNEYGFETSVNSPTDVTVEDSPLTITSVSIFTVCFSSPLSPEIFVTVTL